jgi:hypothetical protein
MSLVDYPAQHREAHAIWRLFESLPLYGAFAEGRIFAWYAANIPMDLGTGHSEFTSDIDVIACLRDKPPRLRQLIYRTWEIKVAVLRRDGSAQSLKIGKGRSIMNQLRAYRAFGAPDISLLDVFLCESGYLASNPLPSDAVRRAIASRPSEMSAEGFGHELLPFEASDDGRSLTVMSAGLPSRNIIKLRLPRPTAASEPFVRLVRDIGEFVERQAPEPRGRRLVVFCRRCRALAMAAPHDSWRCALCGSDLALQ